MKITVIRDASDPSELGEEVRQQLVSFFEQNRLDYRMRHVQAENLHHCIGCFQCWLKTPGICVFDDLGRTICQDQIQSDIVIFVSPLQYGCYSPAIRRVWDRSIPNILPFFKTVGRDVHHKPRYERYPSLVMLGYGAITDTEAETFKLLADANAVNFQTQEAQVYTCRNSADIVLTMDSLSTYLGRKEEPSCQKKSV